MPFLGAILALAGRFVGRLLTMAFGWASLMLFGRVPRSKQVLLAAVALGALVWAAVLVGLLVAPVADLMLSLVPLPDWFNEDWRRGTLLVIFAVLPPLIGMGGLFLTERDARPRDPGGIAVQILRGYPYAAVLALTLVVLSVIAPIRRIQGMARGWEETHIPMIVQPGGYQQVVSDLEAALDSADLDVEPREAPSFVELPSKVLAVVGGTSVRALVPDRLVVLRRPGLEVTLHPTDVAITGRKKDVARARATIAISLPFTRAYLTATEEGQRIEDRLVAVAAGPGAEARAGLSEIDRRLATEVIPEDDWEILYRERLQLERDLQEHAVDGTWDDSPRPSNPAAWLVRLVRGLLR
jgi:hypothetical protein